MGTFRSAEQKLEDSRSILQQLAVATDALSFRSLFNSFLSSARAITYALQKDGKQIPGFSNWYAIKQEEMKSDELLSFVRKARNEDFHEGRHRLAFSMYVIRLASTEFGPPPAPDASYEVGPEGPFWIVDKGTPHERRVPITSGIEGTIRVSVTDPPTMHRSKRLAQNDPITICQLALAYLSELVHEAKRRFGS